MTPSTRCSRSCSSFRWPSRSAKILIALWAWVLAGYDQDRMRQIGEEEPIRGDVIDRDLAQNAFMERRLIGDPATQSQAAHDHL